MKIKSDSKCVKCGSSENLTNDHIIPKKFLRRLRGIGISGLKDHLQILCVDCNQKKGKYIEWEDPKVRELMREVAAKIIDNINKHELAQNKT